MDYRQHNGGSNHRRSNGGGGGGGGSGHHRQRANLHAPSLYGHDASPAGRAGNRNNHYDSGSMMLSSVGSFGQSFETLRGLDALDDLETSRSLLSSQEDVLLQQQEPPVPPVQPHDPLDHHRQHQQQAPYRDDPSYYGEDPYYSRDGPYRDDPYSDDPNQQQQQQQGYDDHPQERFEDEHHAAAVAAARGGGGSNYDYSTGSNNYYNGDKTGRKNQHVNPLGSVGVAALSHGGATTGGGGTTTANRKRRRRILMMLFAVSLLALLLTVILVAKKKKRAYRHRGGVPVVVDDDGAALVSKYKNDDDTTETTIVEDNDSSSSTGRGRDKNDNDWSSSTGGGRDSDGASSSTGGGRDNDDDDKVDEDDYEDDFLSCCRWVSSGQDLVSQMGGIPMHALEHYGHAVAMNAEGTRIAVGLAGQNTRIGLVDMFDWTTTTNGTTAWQRIATLKPSPGSYTHTGPEHQGLSLSADGSAVAFTQADVFFVSTFDPSTSKFRNHKFDYRQNFSIAVRHTHIGGEMSLSANGQAVAVLVTNGGADSLIQVLAQQEDYTGHRDAINSPWQKIGQEIMGGQYVSLSGDGTRMAVSMLDSVVVYDLRVNPATQQTFWKPIGQPLTLISSSSQYNETAVGDGDGDGGDDTANERNQPGRVSLSQNGLVLAVGTHHGKGNAVGVYELVQDEDAFDRAKEAKTTEDEVLDARDYLTWQNRGQGGALLRGDNPSEQFGSDVKLNANGTILMVGAPGMSFKEAQEKFGADPDSIHSYQHATSYLFGRVHLFHYYENNNKKKNKNKKNRNSNKNNNNDEGDDSDDDNQQKKRGGGGEWKPMGDTIVRGGRGGMFGTSVALSADGHKVVAGAPTRSVGNLTDVGAALVYEWKRREMNK